MAAVEAQVGASWGSPPMAPGRHDLGIPAILVPAGTRCGIRIIGAKHWRQHRTTRNLTFRAARNTEAGQAKRIFRYAGWELIVPKDRTHFLQANPEDLLD